ADAFLYTGKIYEYLTSGRPILAILDAGPAAALLRESGDRAVFASTDVEGVAAWLGAALRSWRSGTYRSQVPDGLPSAWDRQFLATRAAEMLSRIVDA
ncbi:MAG TPA: hypothetical protein VL503_02375, partial [Candidatus Omnitrophota bacterium]|nr:hypothetical protein [Candidatus Omnitrophota bacterium]